MLLVYGLLAAFMSSVANGGSWRVISGIDARPHEFPSLVSIQMLEDHFCGGTLLNEDTVLTAAHCIFEYKDDKESTLRIFNLTVIVAEHHLEDRTGREEVHLVKRITIPYQYTGPKSFIRGHDIAILKLATKVSPSIYATFVELSTDALDEQLLLPGSSVQVVGWGSLVGSGEGNSPVLQKTRLSVITNKQCGATFYSAANDLGRVCASASYVTGACKGDSGGPLFARFQGKLIQVGLVSYSKLPCGKANIPTVFTRVSQYRDWIRQNIDRQ